MRKFNGMLKPPFNIFLKECEERFNMGPSKEFLKDLKNLLKEYSEVSPPSLQQNTKNLGEKYIHGACPMDVFRLYQSALTASPYIY